MCPYALSPDSTELQAGDVSRVGVGQQNGGSSSYHMPVHRRAADCKAFAAKRQRQRDPKRPPRFIFILYDAALFCNGHYHRRVHSPSPSPSHDVTVGSMKRVPLLPFVLFKM